MKETNILETLVYAYLITLFKTYAYGLFATTLKIVTFRQHMVLIALFWVGFSVPLKTTAMSYENKSLFYVVMRCSSDFVDLFINAYIFTYYESLFFW